jgi:predicted DNA-binding protein (UPF0251 family)
MDRGRKKKVRYIQKMPQTLVFSPRGKPGRPEEIELKIDQFEAFKLADFQGYGQAEGAKSMGISRPSFGRILREAREVVSDALVNGKIIRIRISDVQVGVRQRNLPLRKEVRSSQELESNIRQSILDYSAVNLPGKRNPSASEDKDGA